MNAALPLLSIVVPCYNEEDVLLETARQLQGLLKRLEADRRISGQSCVYFIDDGSRDRTWEIIEGLRSTHSCFGGVKLSRNRGHQNALLTGLLASPGDVLVSIDADLQDDVAVIESMLIEASQGADIVYGVRSARATDTAMKRWTAQTFYRLLKVLAVEVIFDHADFRLMTRRSVEALRQYEESNLFLRALIPQLGYRTAVVTYERAERFAGTSKYPLSKMLALALEGVTSFSTRPLRMVTVLGCFVSSIALFLTLWAILASLVFESTIPGWASTVIPIYLICGVQMLCLGIIGEYIGKIYLETKRRPRAHIEQIIHPHLRLE